MVRSQNNTPHRQGKKDKQVETKENMNKVQSLFKIEINRHLNIISFMLLHKLHIYQHKLANKSISTRNRSPLSDILTIKFPQTPNNYKLLSIFLVTFQSLIIKTLELKLSHFEIQEYEEINLVFIWHSSYKPIIQIQQLCTIMCFVI